MLEPKIKTKRKRDDELNAQRGAANDPWHRGGSALATAPLPQLQLYRFSDLVALNILTSRAQLAKMIKCDGFPKGVLLSPQMRAWRASDVEAWLASRPTEIKPRGRAKKLVEQAAAKNAGEAA
jgi:predicted DNA-binding transcriptional regulator AlpA